MAEATTDLIGNKIADTVVNSYNKITKASKSSPQNNSETVEIERYISPEKKTNY